MKSLAALFVCVALVTAPLPAQAQEVYPIVFPVAGPTTVIDSFGDPRPGGRIHEGVDMMADKMTPVLAAADGTVGWMHAEQGGNCCDMELIHDDGYSSVYIHLNNDTPGTDDGLGWGFAPGIYEGAKVTAGQVIGYVGDSGNAEAVSPHLHFELRDPSGVAFDPYPSLLAATVIDPAKADEMFFYRSSDGVFKYYDINPDASLGAPVKEGVYSLGWDSITAVDLDGDAQDEFFFYRSSDGVFKYYDILSDGSLGSPIKEGVYSLGWDSITKVDLDGDGQDEFFFYRSSDGVFKYYDVLSTGALGAPIQEGVYSVGWDSITAVDLDGDAQDEFFFYRSSDGVFKYYDVLSDGALGSPIKEGVYSLGWDSITKVDLEGDSLDEFFFYRSADGVFKYYDVNPDGSLGAPIKEGVYSLGWDSITGLNLD